MGGGGENAIAEPFRVLELCNKTEPDVLKPPWSRPPCAVACGTHQFGVVLTRRRQRLVPGDPVAHANAVLP